MRFQKPISERKLGEKLSARPFPKKKKNDRRPGEAKWWVATENRKDLCNRWIDVNIGDRVKVKTQEESRSGCWKQRIVAEKKKDYEIFNFRLRGFSCAFHGADRLFWPHERARTHWPLNDRARTRIPHRKPYYVINFRIKHTHNKD